MVYSSNNDNYLVENEVKDKFSKITGWFPIYMEFTNKKYEKKYKTTVSISSGFIFSEMVEIMEDIKKALRSSL